MSIWNRPCRKVCLPSAGVRASRRQKTDEPAPAVRGPFIFRHRDGPGADARPEDAGPGAVKGARRGGSAADVAADALWAGAVADAAEAVFRGGPVAVPEAGAPRDAAEGAGPGAGDVRDASAEDGHRAGAVEDAPVAEGNAREAAGPACRHSCAAFREQPEYPSFTPQDGPWQHGGPGCASLGVLLNGRRQTKGPDPPGVRPCFSA